MRSTSQGLGDGAGGSRVALYAAIRRDARAGMSNRALQRKHGVGYRTVVVASGFDRPGEGFDAAVMALSRRTVVAALESAWPKERKPPPKRGSRLDQYRGFIDDWLRADLDAPRKQRHTAKRIFDRLLDEHHATDVSSWMVREYVATRRREIRIEAGREPANTFIPQEHLPGREAEVDFGEVAVRLRGELVAKRCRPRPPSPAQIMSQRCQNPPTSGVGPDLRSQPGPSTRAVLDRGCADDLRG